MLADAEVERCLEGGRGVEGDKEEGGCYGEPAWALVARLVVQKAEGCWDVPEFLALTPIVPRRNHRMQVLPRERVITATKVVGIRLTQQIHAEQ